MRTLLTPVLVVLISAQVWADAPESTHQKIVQSNQPPRTDATTAQIEAGLFPPGLEKLSQVEVAIIDVLMGMADVKPSLIPPMVFDRLYEVERHQSQRLANADSIYEKADKDSHVEYFTEGFKRGYMVGQRDALIGLLYAVGILRQNSVIREYVDTAEVRVVTRNSLSKGHLFYSNTTTNLRALATMLLLLNFKEERPTSPGELIVVSSAPKILQEASPETGNPQIKR